MSRSVRVVREKGVLLASVATALLLGVLCLAQSGRPAAKGETAGKRFKNIKVLKNLPADQLMPAMRSFSKSLGVRCDACHVVGPNRSGFDKDDKKMKRVARQMIVLVEHLNKTQKVLKGKATCFMCHHGNSEPETHPGGGEREEEHEGGERR
jgi:hypothetical protein